MGIGVNTSEKRKQKLKLIKQIFELELKKEPRRHISWYGDKFDELYDMGVFKLDYYFRLFEIKTK